MSESCRQWPLRTGFWHLQFSHLGVDLLLVLLYNTSMCTVGVRHFYYITMSVLSQMTHTNFPDSSIFVPWLHRIISQRFWILWNVFGTQMWNRHLNSFWSAKVLALNICRSFVFVPILFSYFWFMNRDLYWGKWDLQCCGYCSGFLAVV